MEVTIKTSVSSELSNKTPGTEPLWVTAWSQRPPPELREAPGLRAGLEFSLHIQTCDLFPPGLSSSERHVGQEWSPQVTGSPAVVGTVGSSEAERAGSSGSETAPLPQTLLPMCSAINAIVKVCGFAKIRS